MLICTVVLKTGAIYHLEYPDMATLDKDWQKDNGGIVAVPQVWEKAGVPISLLIAGRKLRYERCTLPFSLILFHKTYIR